MTAVIDEVDAAFEAGLLADANKAPPPEVPAPPRKVERDPDAPHGRAEDGTPHAPYGIGQNGKPRIKPAGPGRAGLSADEKPRVAASAPGSPQGGKAGGGADYTAGLVTMGEYVWMLGSVNQGFGVGKRKMKDGTEKPLLSLPDTRPYAMLFRKQIPMFAAALNEGAKQSERVRQWVTPVAGDGDGGTPWVLGLAMAGGMFALGCAQLSKAPQQVRDQMAAANDQALEHFFESMFAKLGLEATDG